MKRISIQLWDQAYDPVSFRNFIMPMLPMSMPWPNFGKRTPILQAV